MTQNLTKKILKIWQNAISFILLFWSLDHEPSIPQKCTVHHCKHIFVINNFTNAYKALWSKKLTKFGKTQFLFFTFLVSRSWTKHTTEMNCTSLEAYFCNKQLCKCSRSSLINILVVRTKRVCVKFYYSVSSTLDIFHLFSKYLISIVLIL